MKVRNRIISFALAMVLLISTIPMNAFAKGDTMYGIGFVTGSKVRLRSEASTSSKIVDSASKGEVVVVISKHDDWYKVVYNLKEGYMHGDYVDVSKTENAELGYGKITASSVNVRSGAGTSYGKINQAKNGEKAYIVGINNGWYKVIFESTVGYILSDYVELTEVPYENDASGKSPKFFKGGKSTGVEVSASALGSSTGSSSTSGSTTTGSSNSSSSSSSTSSSTTVSSGIIYGIGFVTGSGLRMRSSASTSAKTVDTASKNEVVVVLSKHGDWYKVIYDLQEGYMHGDYLKVSTTENAELGYGKVTASAVNIRSGAGTSYGKVAQAKRGEKAYIIGINNGWYKVIFGNSIGYLRSDYIDLTEVPYENNSSSKSPKFFRGGKSTGVAPSASALNGSTGSSSGSSSSGSTSSSKTTGDKIVAKAKQYLGVPYKWGGTDPSGFDCSGFVYYVLRSLGINVSRTQTAMYAQGTPVSKSNLQPGDVVFFQNTYKAGLSHVGIYVGNGQFIHAPSSGKVVSYANLNTDYYIAHYYGAVRYTN